MNQTELRQSARRVAVSRLEDEPTTQRRADTQRRLLDAGRKIITEFGVGGASVGLITQEAGFSRGAFYSNFTDMDHFVSRLAEREWQAILGAIAEKLDQAIPGTLHDQGTRADQIAAELMESTQPLLSSVDSQDAQRFELLSQAILSAIPRDRDFHLLWSSLANFMVRDPEGSQKLRAASYEFRSGVAQYVVAALDQLGLVALVEPIDLVDIMIGIGTRSAQTKLVGADAEPSDDLLDRTVPQLLQVLIGPVGNDGTEVSPAL